jgi:hypothetical protein
MAKSALAAQLDALMGKERNVPVALVLSPPFSLLPASEVIRRVRGLLASLMLWIHADHTQNFEPSNIVCVSQTISSARYPPLHSMVLTYARG